MTFTLLALTPYSGEAKTITSLQEAVFRQTGMAAGLALPPLVPLCYLPGGYNKNALIQILKAHKWRTELLTGKLQLDEPNLYLEIRPAAGSEIFTIWQEDIRTRLLASYRPPPPAGSPAGTLIPPWQGFFIGRTSSPDLLLKLPASQKLRFQSLRLELFSINIHTPLPVWWQNIEWEILDTIKCKLSPG